MIRFVDLRHIDAPGNRFAFWDTVIDKFIELDGHHQAFETWEEFEESFGLANERERRHSPLERFKGLCPDWVFSKDPTPPKSEPATPLTLEQLAEGRAIAEAAWSYNSWQDGADFFRDHGKALMACAERVAREDAVEFEQAKVAPTPTELSPFQAGLLAAARSRADAVRLRAAVRFGELQPEADREFAGRPWVPDDFPRPLPERGFQPKHVVAWFEARGLRVRVHVREGTLKQRAQMLFDPIECIGDEVGKLPFQGVGLSVVFEDKADQ